MTVDYKQKYRFNYHGHDFNINTIHTNYVSNIEKRRFMALPHLCPHFPHFHPDTPMYFSRP